MIVRLYSSNANTHTTLFYLQLQTNAQPYHILMELKAVSEDQLNQDSNKKKPI